MNIRKRVFLACVGLGFALFAAYRLDREGWLAAYTAGLALFYVTVRWRD